MKRLCLILLSTPLFVFGQVVESQEVVIINEVAWMGTSASANDEWIELFNPAEQPVNLSGWRVESEDGSPVILLSGSISGHGYAVLERTNDQSAPGAKALVVYAGALENGGENLLLLDSHGVVVDRVEESGGWAAGNSTTRQTMERSGDSWQTSMNPGGTPGTENSEVLPQQKTPLQGREGYMAGVPF
ncbi:MAG: lamin tail domain-containing protein, partial [bacterium]|nr:lamin tail domain-containing protein [bacterium]